MFKDRFGALTNRRALFRRGAVVSGAAAAAGVEGRSALVAGLVEPSASLPVAVAVRPEQQESLRRRIAARAEDGGDRAARRQRDRTDLRVPARVGKSDLGCVRHCLRRADPHRPALAPRLSLPLRFAAGVSAAVGCALELLPTPFRTFTVALAIYAGAYLTEIFGAGILSVGRRYLDAGRSPGLRRFALARYVTAPIMFRTVLPSLSNTFISLFKDTGIAFFIGVRELSFAANKINTDFFRPIESWLAAGALYLVTAFVLAFVLRFLESRIRWSV
ncbi:MAG TPA: ABC transporter permease subunit [Thermomicrobiales bacterium]